LTPQERAENAAKRCRQIIEATVRCSVKNGWPATTLATVSADAGCRKGLRSSYFKNKQNLLGEASSIREAYQQHWLSAREKAGPDRWPSLSRWSRRISIRRPA
jgi:AcrR family transcriptional regulator